MTIIRKLHPLVIALLFWGCATSQLPPNATNAQRAAAAISDAEKGAKLLIGPAVTAYLITVKPAEQARRAAMVYTVATAVNSAATGAILSAYQLSAILTSFGHNDPTILQLAQVISSTYASVYGLFPVAGSSPAKFLSDIALTAENAAQPFLAHP